MMTAVLDEAEILVLSQRTPAKIIALKGIRKPGYPLQTFVLAYP
jgi:hypothetical protein